MKMKKMGKIVRIIERLLKYKYFDGGNENVQIFQKIKKIHLW